MIEENRNFWRRILHPTVTSKVTFSPGEEHQQVYFYFQIGVNYLLTQNGDIW